MKGKKGAKRITVPHEKKGRGHAFRLTQRPDTFKEGLKNNKRRRDPALDLCAYPVLSFRSEREVSTGKETHSGGRRNARPEVKMGCSHITSGGVRQWGSN